MSRRWLIIHPGPEFSVHDVYVGWVEALRGLGEQVDTYNLHDRLNFYDGLLIDTGHDDGEGHPEMRKAVTHHQAIWLAASGLMGSCYRWWPDVVLGISAFFTPPNMLDIMRDRGHTVILLHTESPYQEAEQLERAQHADINLLNDPSNLDAYRQLGRAAYMPHAYRPSLHKPGPADPQLKCDLAFSGTGYDSRIEFFEQMDLAGIDTLLAGNWTSLSPTSPLRDMVVHELDECLDNEQTVDMYRSARAGLNLYRREAEDAHVGEGYSMGPREVEMAASQLFFLRDPRGEGDEVFPMLPTFDGPGDASSKLRWWLAHDREREAAAARAREAVSGRTFEANARRLLQMLDS